MSLKVVFLVGTSVALAQPPARLVPYENVTYALLDTPVLRARVLPYDPRGINATFAFEATCCGYGPFTPSAVQATSDAFGLWDVPCGRPAEPAIAEWGYEFFNNANNIFPVCGNLTEAGYAAPPANRSEAQERVQLYWLCRAAAARATTPNATLTSPVLSEIGHYLLGGHSALWGGVGVVGSEVGENINSINLHLAMTRGAARQFGVPFLIDFSPWMQGFILDYSSPGFWGQASSPVGGHSISLFRRTYYAAFMGGAGRIVAEAGAVDFFFENTTANGTFNLSPLGEVGLGFARFAHGGGSAIVSPSGTNDLEAWRGIPYVPVALLVELEHGMGLGFFYNGRAWDVFTLSQGEARIAAWLQCLWPNSFLVENDFHNPAKAESDYMVGGPYGDIADVLLPAALPGAVSESYRAIFAVGIGSSLDAQLAATLAAAVGAGGLLVIDSDDITSAGAWALFPAGFFGASVGAAAPVTATAARDAQTGWMGGSTVPRVLNLPSIVWDSVDPAAPLLLLEPGLEVAAVLHNFGNGTVVLLLGLDAISALGSVASGGLGIADHLLARVSNDTSPITVECSGCGDSGQLGLQVSAASKLRSSRGHATLCKSPGFAGTYIAYCRGLEYHPDQ
jgi:hypothetical protein